MFNMSFIFFLFGEISSFVILKFLGKKKNKTRIDDNSLTILESTIKLTALSIPF